MSQPVFYTTQLQAGLGLLEETRLLLALYEPGITASQLTQKALDSGQFPLVTARRLSNIVGECFATRYMRQPNVATYMKRLAVCWPREFFHQLLCLYTARANRILADFLREVYWQRYSAGRDQLAYDEAEEFVRRAVQDGKTQKIWAESTIRRMSSYLIGCCSDYGFLAAEGRQQRAIRPLRMGVMVAAYLVYDLRFQGLSDNAILTHEDWGLFGLDSHDVRDLLKRLSLQGLLILQSAADVVQISWTYASMEEVVNVIAEG